MSARQREVRLGTRLPGQVEVISGLEAGELVVSHGTLKLRADSPVIIKAIDLVLGLRVETAAEETGLDIAVHGETAYVPWSGGTASVSAIEASGPVVETIDARNLSATEAKPA